ncbi:beta-lactamase family protein [Xylariaceae sp. FL0662B]|nr:beta-lactamase family protein [Xylariaceae sp. FL0662B]
MKTLGLNLVVIFWVLCSEAMTFIQSCLLGTSSSCTKLIAPVSTLRQVDRGHIGLDDDAEKMFPELAGLEMLEGLDHGGNPIYKKRGTAITLRDILSYLSGFCYPLYDHKLLQLKREPSAAPRRPIVIKDWIYGSVRMKYVSFSLEMNLELRVRKVGMSLRDESGKLAPTTEGYVMLYEDRDEAYDERRATCWVLTEAYLRLLQYLCADDGTVLSKLLVDEMFPPQLGQKTNESMNHSIKSTDVCRRTQACSFNMDHQELDYSLWGVVGPRDEVGRRKAGAVWIDMKTGLCGANFFTAGAAGRYKLEAVFERAVYEQYKKFRNND